MYLPTTAILIIARQHAERDIVMANPSRHTPVTVTILR